MKDKKVQVDKATAKLAEMELRLAANQVLIHELQSEVDNLNSLVPHLNAQLMQVLLVRDEA